MTITQLNYLDPANLLIWELIGSPELTMLVAAAMISWVGAKYNWPIEITIPAIILVIAAIVGYAYNALVWALLLVIVAIAVYSLVPKIFRR